MVLRCFKMVELPFRLGRDGDGISNILSKVDESLDDEQAVSVSKAFARQKSSDAGEDGSFEVVVGANNFLFAEANN